MVDDFSSIHGLDTLWEAFLRSGDANVVTDAGDLLAQLHLRLTVPSDKQRVWDRWVHCVAVLTAFSCLGIAFLAFNFPVLDKSTLLAG